MSLTRIETNAFINPSSIAAITPGQSNAPGLRTVVLFSGASYQLQTEVLEDVVALCPDLVFHPELNGHFHPESIQTAAVAKAGNVIRVSLRVIGPEGLVELFPEFATRDDAFNFLSKFTVAQTEADIKVVDSSAVVEEGVITPPAPKEVKETLNAGVTKGEPKATAKGKAQQSKNKK